MADHLREVVSLSSGEVFAGRIGPATLAYWVLFAIIANVTLSAVSASSEAPVLLLVAGLLSLFLTAATLSAWVRRMHDIGRSGWTLLWALVPLAGLIYLIYLGSRPGDPTANSYGEPPAP